MDVIVYDDEFRAFGDSISTFGAKMDDIFERYIQCMDKLCHQAIVSGNTSDNIEDFVNSISVLKGDLSSITSCVKANCNNYIQDIDQADDFLY